MQFTRVSLSLAGLLTASCLPKLDRLHGFADDAGAAGASPSVQATPEDTRPPGDATTASTPRTDGPDAAADSGGPPALPPANVLALRDIELGSSRGVWLEGGEGGDGVGSSVALAGDVNGDGFADLIVGAPGSSETSPGRVYVVFGGTARSNVSLGSLGARGFSILGANAGDRIGGGAAAAGDVNGDGLDDLLVDAPFANVGYGATYVVFGKADTEPVSLAALGNGGFAIDSLGPDAVPTQRAGDVNGDGLGDLIVGEPQAGDAGAAYVVFGKRDVAPVELSLLGNDGFRIVGAVPGDGAGRSVAAAGDVNGDGLADLLVGSGFNTFTDTGGKAYVVFGKRDASDVTLALVEAGQAAGFALFGARLGDFSQVVAGVGDIDGDGLDDIAISAPESTDRTDEPVFGRYGGLVYVIFGKASPAPVTVAALNVNGAEGFVIAGARENDRAGFGLAASGDVDGDGLGDIVLGARFAIPHGSTCSAFDCAPGAAYVVFGRARDASPVLLGDIENGAPGGLALKGANTADIAGTSVSGGGDLDGDGFDDVLVGAPGLAPQGAPAGVGKAYAIFGSASSSDTGAAPGLLRGGPASDVLTHDGSFSRGRIDGGNGIDTLRLSAGALLLRQSTVPGSAGSPALPRNRMNVTSVEIIDLAASAATLELDDAAVRGLPHSQAGLPFNLAKSLVVLGDAADTLHMDLNASDWELAGMNAGRRVYRRIGAFYGLELASQLSVSP